MSESETMIPVLAPFPQPAEPVRKGWPKGKKRTKAVHARTAAPRVASPRTAADAATVGIASNPGPAERAEPSREVVTDTEPRTRVRREQRAVGGFDLPVHMKKPGWDYQWDVDVVLGQPVDGSQKTILHEAGWRVETCGNWLGYCPPGSGPSDPMQRLGQTLYSRPMHLTLEARQEDVDAAQQQVRDRVQGALEGRVKGGEGVADVRGVRPIGLQLEIVGEAGAGREPVRRRD